jgi:hypothetical protein
VAVARLRSRKDVAGVPTGTSGKRSARLAGGPVESEVKGRHAQFKLVDQTPPPDSPRPIVSPYRLQAEPARKWKNLQGIPVGWLISEFGGGSPVANVAFLKQVGCSVEMLRLRDHGIIGNGNLMLLEKNNHEVFAVIRDWLDQKVDQKLGRA